MKVTSLTSPIPFSEQQFELQVSGLELAVIRYLISNCAVGMPEYLGYITFSMYGATQQCVGKIDYGLMGELGIPNIPVRQIKTQDFKEKIDELYK